jgi:hypothetical protein
LVIRFFGYSERYKKFRKAVGLFLNDYIKEKNEKGFNQKELRKAFTNTLQFKDKYFAYGFTKGENHNSVPRVRFEALSVGINLALQVKPDLKMESLDWMKSERFTFHTTTHASNSQPRLSGRIEFVRDTLLGRKPKPIKTK